MALIWYDNFADQAGPTTSYWLNTLPYVQFGVDSPVSGAPGGPQVQIIDGRPAMYPSRRTSILGTSSYRMLPFQAASLPYTIHSSFSINTRALSGSSSLPRCGFFSIAAYESATNTMCTLMSVYTLGTNIYVVYAESGEVKTLQTPYEGLPRAPAAPSIIDISVTKVENNRPDVMSEITIYLNNNLVLSGNYLNNGFHVSDMMVGVCGWFIANPDNLRVSEGVTQILGGNVPAVYEERWNYYSIAVNDDTGPPPFNKRLGKVRIDTRKPASDVQAEMTRPAGAASNAAVMAQAPIVTTNFLEGTAGQEDEYNLQPIGDGLNVLAVKTLTAGTKTVADGYDFKPFIQSGETKVESDMPLDLSTTTYHTTIHETNPDTGAKWTSEEVNAMTTGLQVVDNETP